MAASHRISRTQGNPAYHAHSFIDFEATTIPGGATSGTVIGVSVGIDEKDDSTDFVAVAAYAYEVPGGAAASMTGYEAAKALAALIQVGIGAEGWAWATETSKRTARINVISKGATTGHFANMTLPVLDVAV